MADMPPGPHGYNAVMQWYAVRAFFYARMVYP